MSILDDQNILQEELNDAISDNYYTPINSFLGSICAENMIGINKYNNLMIFKNCHWVIDEVLSGECLKVLIDAGATLNDLQNDNIKNYLELHKDNIISAINIHNYSIYCTTISINKDSGNNRIVGIKNDDYNGWINSSGIYCNSNDSLNTIKANNSNSLKSSTDAYLSIGKS